MKAANVTPHSDHRLGQSLAQNSTKQADKKYFLLSTTKDPFQFHNRLVDVVEVAEGVLAAKSK